jgi:GxxExxY protein
MNLSKEINLQSNANTAIGINQIPEKIIGCAIEVHKYLGPGLLESTYEECLAYELSKSNIPFERQKPLPVIYKETKLDCGYRIDIFADQKVIVEIKAIDALLPIHEAQLLTYLKLSGCKVGLIINFNVKLLKQGLKRIICNV